MNSAVGFKCPRSRIVAIICICRNLTVKQSVFVGRVSIHLRDKECAAS